MANYGKYYVAVRLLLKRYLEANAGRNRTVSRKELEDLLRDNEMPIKNPKTLYADLAALESICGLTAGIRPAQKGLPTSEPAL